MLKLFATIPAFLAGMGISTLHAQEIYFKNVSNDLQTPSQECYNVMQDSKSYLWICTENGLLKYSKGKTKLFDKKNGLYENSIYYINENHNGEIELISSANRLLIIKNDSLYEHPISKRFQEFIKKTKNKNTFNLSYLIHRDGRNNFIINTQQRTVKIQKSDGQLFDYTTSNPFQSDAYLIVDKTDANTYFIKNRSNYYDKEYEKNQEIKIDIISGKKRLRETVKLGRDASFDWRIRLRNLNGISYLTLHDRLLIIDEDLNVKQLSFPSVITAIYVSKKHGLWIGTSSFGVYHFENLNELKNPKRGLKDLTVSSIWVDTEGGTWCTTTQKGVYYSANYNVLYYKTYNELNKKTTLLKAINDKVYISTEIDRLKIVDENNISNLELIKTGNAEITDIRYFNNQYFIATKGYIGILDPQYRLIKILQHFDLEAGKKRNATVYQLDMYDGELYALGVGLIYKLNKGIFSAVGPSFLSKPRCFKIVNDSIAYVGSNEGIYKINLIDSSQIKIPNIQTAVSKIIVSQSGELYFTTKGQGLFRIQDENAIPIYTGKENYMLNDIIEYKKNQFWVASGQGLVKLTKHKNNYQHATYNSSNGLLSDYSEQLTISGNNLFVSSREGIYNFNLNENLHNATPPVTYIEKVWVNDSLVPYSGEHFVLNYTENSISVSVDVLSFKKGKDEALLYKMNGLDKDYKKAISNIISYPNLGPGTYTLEIYAQNNEGIRSPNPILLTFSVRPPFWKTYWFVILVSLASLSLIGLFVRWQISTVKKKEAEKTRINKLIAESQLRGLQAQMNPHFIFNAINSIQNYVLNKNVDEAYGYLAKFSKLIRMVLNNSRENEVSLQAELETLTLYIELEKLRFDNVFDFSLRISDDINPFETQIPSMLIQPFIENAIWHGLMNLRNERRGLLSLDISIENKLLKVQIEDNGVGRVQSAKFKTGNIHHSLATQLTEERLELIRNLENTKNIKIEIHDLYDSAAKACGTKVEIYLPLDYGTETL